MELKQAKIREDIDRLITLIHKNPTADCKEDIHVYARKILNSNMSRPIPETTLELKDKILARVGNTSEQRTVLHTQELIQRFMNSNAIHKKAEVLKMLLRLSELMDNGDNLSNIFRDTKRIQLNTTQETTIANITQLQQPIHRALPHQQYAQIRNKGCTELKISESDIIREVIYVLQNISSTMIIQENGVFQLRANISVPDSVRRMVSQICEIGWFYRKITAPFKEEGMVIKSLGLAIQEQMSEYYRWLATMENMLKTEQLTLRKFVLWSYEPYETLKWLAMILQAARPYNGCQIISVINSYRPQGSTPINELLNRFLAHLLQPLFQYIYHWMYRGELLDSKQQFFIEENKRVEQKDVWSLKYTLVNARIPNIIDHESAEKIFNTGKSIYFLRHVCNCNYNLEASFLDIKSVLDTKMQESTTILSMGFKKWLQAVHEEASSKLVKVMFTQFSLKEHLTSMKHFFLLGKGDFIQHLFDSLKDELSKPKHEIYEQSLDGYISEGISKCFPEHKGRQSKNPSGYRASIIDRVIAKKVDNGNEGWDCFNLQYSMDRIEPIETVLSPECMRNYQKIFSFLWKVRRVEQTLKDIWLMHSKDYPRTNALMKEMRKKSISQLFHASHLLRCNMMHFLSNLYGYLLIAIESAWKNFTEQLDTVTTFDEIFKIHKEFQSEVLEITLTSAKSKVACTALNNTFNTINKFKINSSNLMREFSDYYERRRRYEDDRKISMKGIHLEHDISVDIPTFRQGQLSKEIEDIWGLYQQTFKTFYDLIRKENQQRLNVLSFRLNFSEFFSERYENYEKM